MTDSKAVKAAKAARKAAQPEVVSRGEWTVTERKTFGPFGKRRWTIGYTASNGQRVVPTEPYNSKANALNGVDVLVTEGSVSPIKVCYADGREEQG